MRVNLPVTDIEYLVEEGEVLVSKTDLNGTITYCNRAFSDASGFLESELIGLPHNIVRHPDVPEQIFADCWGTIKTGNSWHGILKNRRKNGDFSWRFFVHATKSPDLAWVCALTETRTQNQFLKRELLYQLS